MAQVTKNALRNKIDDIVQDAYNTAYGCGASIKYVSEKGQKFCDKITADLMSYFEYLNGQDLPQGGDNDSRASGICNETIGVEQVCQDN